MVRHRRTLGDMEWGSPLALHPEEALRASEDLPGAFWDLLEEGLDPLLGLPGTSRC